MAELCDPTRSMGYMRLVNRLAGRQCEILLVWQPATPASRTRRTSTKLLIFPAVTRTSAPFCSWSFHPIRCDFVAAFWRENSDQRRDDLNSSSSSLDGSLPAGPDPCCLVLKSTEQCTATRAPRDHRTVRGVESAGRYIVSPTHFEDLFSKIYRAG